MVMFLSLGLFAVLTLYWLAGGQARHKIAFHRPSYLIRRHGNNAFSHTDANNKAMG